MIAGLALALGSALGSNVAFLFEQRGAVLAPAVRGRHPLRSAVGLFRSRWFSLGWAVAVVAWALHVGALALAPLSVVQAVLSGVPDTSRCATSRASSRINATVRRCASAL
jgi:hypothetical protein